MHIAVTGGIAAGKSTVAAALLAKLQGYKLISIDQLISDIYEQLNGAQAQQPASIRELYQALISRFGSVNRYAIRQQVVNNAEALSFLERLFYSLALAALDEHRAKHQDLIIEFPLLIESGYHNRVDFIVNVEASYDSRLGRALSRSDELTAKPKPAGSSFTLLDKLLMTDDEFHFFASKQDTDLTRRAFADYTIVNENEFPTLLKEALSYHADVIALKVGIAGNTTAAIVSGSFDPIQNGHRYLIKEALKLFDTVIVVVACNPAKSGLFSLEERISLIRSTCAGLEHVHVIALRQGELVVGFAETLGVRYIVRGLRNSSDFEYERQLDLVQARANHTVRTIFLMTPRELTEVSSSMVKALYGLNGWVRIVEPYVPRCVVEAMSEKLKQHRLLQDS